MDQETLEGLARRDGIEPATEEELEFTLTLLNGLHSLVGTRWEVLRW
jgi:hypothetical protein